MGVLICLKAGLRLGVDDFSFFSLSRFSFVFVLCFVFWFCLMF